MSRISFHLQLKRLKEKNGYSSQELANKLNVTRRTVNSWLSGDSQPKANQVYKLAETFGVTPNELFLGEMNGEVVRTINSILAGLPQEQRMGVLDLINGWLKVTMPHIKRVSWQD